MKRIIAIALSVLMLMSVLATTAFATTGGVKAAASVALVKPGDTVEVTLSVYGYESVTNIGFGYEVPEGLVLESASWLVDGDILAIDSTANRAAFATQKAIDMTSETPVFKFTFSVQAAAVNVSALELLINRVSVENNYQLIAQNDATVTLSVSSVVGDMNGDERLNDSDAMYLLRYTLFGPARYPLPEGVSGDVNNSGNVDDADAMYLLRHTLFPTRFPLYPVK